MDYSSGPSRVGLVIAAAGAATRFGAVLPKQLHALGEKPLYLHSVETALRTPGIDRIALVVPIAHAHAFDGALALDGAQEKVTIVHGGPLRRDSVYLALEHLREHQIDFVMVHDAARAFVTVELMIGVMEAMLDYGAAIAAVPVVDTIKRVRDNVIDSTVDRTDLWRAQTPQGAALDVLLEAYRSAIADDFVATDEASVLERAGVAVHVVMGDEENVKITYPADLAKLR